MSVWLKRTAGSKEKPCPCLWTWTTKKGDPLQIKSQRHTRPLQHENDTTTLFEWKKSSFCHFSHLTYIYIYSTTINKVAKYLQSLSIIALKLDELIFIDSIGFLCIQTIVEMFSSYRCIKFSSRKHEILSTICLMHILKQSSISFNYSAIRIPTDHVSCDSDSMQA